MPSKRNNSWKSLNKQFKKFKRKRNHQNGKTKHAYNDITQSLLCLQLSVPSSIQSSPSCSGNSSEFDVTECVSPVSPVSPFSPSSYKLLSTAQMAITELPRYYFTNEEHFIMRQAWYIITNINVSHLFDEFKQVLFNDTELKNILNNNCVDIREQFDMIYEMFDKITSQKEYQQYKYSSEYADIIDTTATVLKMIGIRQANIYKIIPNDYTDFGSCFYILFEKYLEEYYRMYPQCRVLLNKCWQFIFNSITAAFDFDD